MYLLLYWWKSIKTRNPEGSLHKVVFYWLEVFKKYLQLLSWSLKGSLSWERLAEEEVPLVEGMMNETAADWQEEDKDSWNYPGVHGLPEPLSHVQPL